MSTSTSGPAAHSRRASRNHRSSVRSSISAAFFSTPEEGEAVITAEPDPDLDDTSLLPHPGVVLKVKPLQKVPKNISIYVNLCSSTHHRLLRDGAKDVKIDPTGQGGPSDAATALDDDAASVKSAATGASSAPEMVIFAGPRRVRKEGTTINHIYDVVVHESELSCLVTRKTVGSAVITDLNKLRDVSSLWIRCRYCDSCLYIPAYVFVANPSLLQTRCSRKCFDLSAVARTPPRRFCCVLVSTSSQPCCI